MKLTKIEQEYDEYFTHDGCEFRRSTEATYIDDEEVSKTTWLYKAKENVQMDGANYSHWLYCSKTESKDLEHQYQLALNES